MAPQSFNMKLSDYVIEFLNRREIRDIFTVSGGGVAHLLDSLGRHPDMRYYCNYHEQACAIAAEGFARVTGKVGAVLVTIGPGAVNALSGIVGAWYDSIPLLVFSGQVRSDLIADYTKVRQKGPQEGNVIEMARPVTKYVVSVREPSQIRYELEKALYLATTGRPGPVWIEIPFDIQGSTIDPEALAGFTPEPESDPAAAAAALSADVASVLEALRNSRRPLIIGGNGVRLSNCHDLFIHMVEQLQIPAVVHAMAKDVLPEDHPLYVGVFGSAGQRRANFAVQNADLVMVLGGSLGVTKVGFNFKGFAPNARKIIVNIDRGQLAYQAIKADVPVHADLKAFLEELQRQSHGAGYRPAPVWLEACANWKRRYPIILDEYYEDRNHVSMYVFMDRLADQLSPEMTVLAGNGFDVVSCYQAFKVKPGQRVIYSGNWGSMGWDLPLAIGACIGGGRQPTVLATGDGSFQWNIQELLTVKYNRLPLKIFILNNQGYASIRSTQNALFEGKLVAADSSCGVGMLDFRKLADLYSFGFERIENNDGITAAVANVLAMPGPVICEVKISTEQVITPKASAFRRSDGTLESRPLEDMAPFLPRQEVWENMHLFDEAAPS
jgi:acetolactate synthase-1/2/3 large subunit